MELNENNTFSSIYLFVVNQPEDGFAAYSDIFMRKNATIAEALKAVTSDVSSWDRCPDSGKLDGLDMKFKGDEETLVFVKLPDRLQGNKFTSFRTTALKDLLELARPGLDGIIQFAGRHQDKHGDYTICSFMLDLKGINSNISAAKLRNGRVRFPIMFDFVDSNDGISPVFKDPEPHSNNVSLTKDVVGIFTHGGIHPPRAASFITVEL
ncbi:MAG: hypothetical protein ING71_02665 [Rhodocyclaceae bacterium]|nr:hypothetical protein [Rhodocyclaceae bacterium]